MLPNYLRQPVGMLMRPTVSLNPEDSLDLAAQRFREFGTSVLPVGNGHYLVGIVTERDLLEALALGAEPTDAVESHALRKADTIQAYSSGAEALRQMQAGGSASLVVIDDIGRIQGLLLPSDLYGRRIVPPRPHLIGGMATPFGVYLTTGSIRAGASHLALVTTGMLLFSLFLGATVVGFGLAVAAEASGMGRPVADAIQGILPFLMFLAGMRLLPISRIHAAEHKVVHAIERGEELTVENVRRMPRVHPRCGTNIAVGLTLFLTMGTSGWIPFPELRLIAAAILTLALWRPLGSLAQKYVTTAPPADRHLQSGIRAGKQLLERYASTRNPYPSFGARVVNSGMLHVMFGSFLCYTLVRALILALGLDIPL
jgi:CBS domain-containing protein